jgi:PAS domain-containing protein
MHDRALGTIGAERLRILITENPCAWVAAINQDGLFIPMPSGTPVGAAQVIDGPASALDVVVPADREAVIAAWESVKAHGYACLPVHPVIAPAAPVDLHFVDVLEAYGVYLGAFTGLPDLVSTTRPEQHVLLPRLSLVRKDRVARLVDVDEALPLILGWSRDELVGRRSLELIHPEDQQRAIAHWMDMLSRKAGNRQRTSNCCAG